VLELVFGLTVTHDNVAVFPNNGRIYDCPFNCKINNEKEIFSRLKRTEMLLSTTAYNAYI
jgi:hypothetical protein